MLELVSISLSSLCMGICCGSAWLGLMPAIQKLTQSMLASRITRIGELGFAAERVAFLLFLAEIICLPFLVWAGYTYLGLILGMTTICILLHLRALVLDWVIEARERLLCQQTLQFATSMLGLARGGLGLAQSITNVAVEIPAPLGIPVRRVAREFTHGRPLLEALAASRSCLKLEAFALLVSSISCAAQRGSSLEASLSGVQESLEHQEQVARQLRAKTSSARTTILILACMPFVFMLLFCFQPSLLDKVFHTAAGRNTLAACLACMYVGIAWARKLTRLK